MIVNDELLRLGVLIANDVIQFEGHVAFLNWSKSEQLTWHYRSSFKRSTANDASQHLKIHKSLMKKKSKVVTFYDESEKTNFAAWKISADSFSGVIRIRRASVDFNQYELLLLGHVQQLMEDALIRPRSLELLKSLHLEFLDQRIFPHAADPTHIVNCYVEKAAALIHPEHFDPLHESTNPASYNSKSHESRVDGKLLSANMTELRIVAAKSSSGSDYGRDHFEDPYVIHRQDCIATRVWKSREAFVTNKLKRIKHRRKVFGDSVSHLSVPIHLGEEKLYGEIRLPDCLGVLTCETTMRDAYNDSKLSALALLGAHAAWPLGRSLIHEHVVRIGNERRIVQEATISLSRSARESDIFDILTEAFKKLQYSRGLYCTVDTSSDTVLGIDSWGDNLMEQLQLQTKRSKHHDAYDCQWLAIDSGQTQIIPDPENDRRVNKQAIETAKLNHFAIVPFVSAHEKIDHTVHIEREDHAPISESVDKPTVEELVRHGVEALERVRAAKSQQHWLGRCLSGGFSDHWSLLNGLAEAAVAGGVATRCRVFRIHGDTQTGFSQHGQHLAIDFEGSRLPNSVANRNVLSLLRKSKKTLLTTIVDKDLERRVADFEVNRVSGIHDEEALGKSGLKEWVEAPIFSAAGSLIAKLVFDHQSCPNTLFTPNELQWISAMAGAATFAIETHGTREIISELAKEGLAADVLRHAIRDVVTLAIDELHDNVLPHIVYRTARNSLDRLRQLSQPVQSDTNIGDKLKVCADMAEPFLKAGRVKLRLNRLGKFQAIHNDDSSSSPFVWVALKLIANAIRSVNRFDEVTDHDGHEVLVKLRRATSSRIALEVEDTGSGLPSSVLEKLEHPVTVIEDAHGEGRGLAYVRLLCAQARWSFTHSRSDSRTKFRVEFPVK